MFCDNCYDQFNEKCLTSNYRRQLNSQVEVLLLIFELFFYFPASSANDELEFVKMYSNSSPSRRRYQSNDNMTLSYDNPATEYPTLDRPPSYETSMRESTTVSDHYGADRRSVRSARSVRSKASNKSKTKSERREELPWVQITPSANSIDQPFRHYP